MVAQLASKKLVKQIQYRNIKIKIYRTTFIPGGRKLLFEIGLGYAVGDAKTISEAVKKSKKFIDEHNIYGKGTKRR